MATSAAVPAPLLAVHIVVVLVFLANCALYYVIEYYGPATYGFKEAKGKGER